jgi:replicative DNA helicase
MPVLNTATDFNDRAVAYGLAAVAADVDRAEFVADPPAATSAWDHGAFDDVLTPEQPVGGESPAWPEPMIPGTQRTPEFPEDILPGVWGDMARAVAASTQTPPALAVMCSLGVLATLLQRRYEVAPYGSEYTEPLSLFVVSASPSGTRKTAVLNAFLAPIVKTEKRWSDQYRPKVAKANAARSTAKKRIEHLNQQAAKCKDPAELATLREDIEREELAMPEEVRAPRLFTGDTTAERLQAMLCEHSERMAVHSDEPGIFRVMAGAYSGGSQNLDVFLQGHAGSAIRVDRAGRLAHLDKPALTFNLMIQPGLMSEIAGSKGFRDSGLLARFLFAVPATNVGKRDVRKHSSIGAEVRERYEDAVMALLEGYLCEPGTVPKVQVLELCDAARDRWLDFSQYIEDRQGDGGEFESIRDWTSKLAGAVARIAALLELARVGLAADVVQYDSMDDAVRLAMVLIPHAQCAFGLLGTDAVGVDAQAVLRWARGRGEESFTQREAQKAMQGRFTNVERLKKAMEHLTEADCVRPFRRSQTGGRPSAGYRLNPALL